MYISASIGLGLTDWSDLMTMQQPSHTIHVQINRNANKTHCLWAVNDTKIKKWKEKKKQNPLHLHLTRIYPVVCAITNQQA